jgi:hypothetical protein
VAVVPPTAALAGVPAGVQANGLWLGRRQLFVRFAAEAETATMYAPGALSGELSRLTARSTYHSISISGRDPLANTAFLKAAFEKHTLMVPIMLDCDGQRPNEIAEIGQHLALFQITLDNTPSDSLIEQAMASLKVAAQLGIAHALVLGPGRTTTDGQVLRVVSEGHAASEATQIVVHPPPAAAEQDRRWLMFMEQATTLHGDIRLLPRLPRPTGMR